MKGTDTTGRRRRAGRTTAEIDAWCARFDNLCRARGLRRTVQRTAVYRAVASDPGHPTAGAVRQRLGREFPSLSLATIYRVLDSLVDEGVVRLVPTSGGGARFDANVAPHQHLVCARCGSMEDFADPRLAAVPLPARAPGGFRPEGLDLRVTGTCADCAASGRGARTRTERTSLTPRHGTAVRRRTTR
jgi:Fur family peroxide stress response transcriptional regulator